MNEKRSVGVGWLAASLLPAVVGLAVSVALAIDYAHLRPVFCEEGSGCDAVRRTLFAAPFGIPMPVFGIAGFVGIGVAALLRGTRARRVQVVVSAGAAAIGALLFAVQAKLGEFCPYCCVADASAMVSVVVAAARLRFAPEAAPSPAMALAMAGWLPIAVAVPLLIAVRSSPVPRVIRDEMARTPRGEVTIVDFVDFECPFCRMMQAELAPLVSAHRDRIRLTRLQVPLRIHPHALDAARAACCGERLGRGDAMAEALFSAPVAELTPDGCERLAVRVGLPLAAFQQCVADPATQARIEADRSEFKAAGGHALPTVWIGDQEFVGAQPAGVLADALRAALRRAGS